MGNDAFHLFDVLIHHLLCCAGLPACVKAKVQPPHVVEEAHTQVIEGIERAGMAGKAADYRQHDAQHDTSYRDRCPHPYLVGRSSRTIKRCQQKKPDDPVDRIERYAGQQNAERRAGHAEEILSRRAMRRSEHAKNDVFLCFLHRTPFSAAQRSRAATASKMIVG